MTAKGTAALRVSHPIPPHSYLSVRILSRPTSSHLITVTFIGLLQPPRTATGIPCCAEKALPLTTIGQRSVMRAVARRRKVRRVEAGIWWRPYVSSYDTQLQGASSPSAEGTEYVGSACGGQVFEGAVLRVAQVERGKCAASSSRLVLFIQRPNMNAVIIAWE